MFTMQSSSSGYGWGKSGTIGGHWVPHSGIEQKFGGIKGVGSDNVKDTLLHLRVFTRAEPNGSLIVGPCSDEFGNDHLEPGVKACFFAEDRK